MAVRRSGIALVGFMGAGKSTVGRPLARRLGWPFLDTDEALASRYGPVHAQITGEGLEVFRAREKALALSLCDGQPRVLATGGGTLLDADVRQALPGSYRMVWLDVPLEVAAERVKGGERPLWDEDVKRRYEERRRIYEGAELRLEAERGVEELVEAVMGWMGR